MSAPGPDLPSRTAGQAIHESGKTVEATSPSSQGDLSWNDLSDQDLLRLCPGEERAAWTIWCRYTAHLEYVVIGLTHLPTWDVEEIMSTAALRFHRQIPKYASRIRNLQAWMSTLVRNVALDYVRRAGRFQRQHLNLEENDLAEPGDWEHALLEQTHAAGMEIREAIRTEIDSLSHRLRETARAHFLEEKSYAEICRLQRIRPATARKRIQMARAQLRQGLSDYLNGRRPLPPAPAAKTEPALEASSRPRFEIECSPVASRFIAAPSCLGGPRYHHLFFSHHLGREQQKLGRLERYVEIHARGWIKQWEAAEISLSLGRWEEALARYEICRRHKSARLSAFLRPARLLQLLRRNEEARLLCLEALQAGPDPASRFHLHALIAETMDQEDHAHSFWQQAMAAEPGNPAHYLGAAELQIREGNSAAAIRLVDNVTALEANHLYGQNLLLDLLFERGDYGAVREYVRRLWSQGEKNAKAIQYAIGLHMGSASPPGVWTHLRRTLASLVEENPGLGRLLEAKAAICAAHGRWRSLELYLEEITSTFPQSPEPWRIRCAWLARTRRPSAFSVLLQALERFPRDPGLLETAAHLSTQEKHTGLFRRFLDRSSLPACGGPRLLLAAAGGVLTLLGQKEEAKELALQAAKCNPDDPAVWLGLGCILVHGQSLPEAIEALEQSWNLATARPGNMLAPFAALYMAHALQLAGRNKDSLTWHHASAASARTQTCGYSFFSAGWNETMDSAANARRGIAYDLERVWSFLWRPLHFLSPSPRRDLPSDSGADGALHSPWSGPQSPQDHDDTERAV